MGVMFVSMLRMLNLLPAGDLAPLPVPDRWLNFWTLDLTTDLPTNGCLNAAMICIYKVTKLVRLVPYSVGNGELTIPSVARLFFHSCGLFLQSAMLFFT